MTKLLQIVLKTIFVVQNNIRTNVKDKVLKNVAKTFYMLVSCHIRYFLLLQWPAVLKMKVQKMLNVITREEILLPANLAFGA